MEVFEIVGYFEEVWLSNRPRESPKFLGTRKVERDLSRKLGVYGERDLTLTEPLTLDRGHKTQTFKASPEKPLHVFTRVYPINGRMLAKS